VSSIKKYRLVDKSCYNYVVHFDKLLLTILKVGDDGAVWFNEDLSSELYGRIARHNFKKYFKEIPVNLKLTDFEEEF